MIHELEKIERMAPADRETEVARAKFLMKVVRDAKTGCWDWSGSLHPRYGRFDFRGDRKLAHRAAYEFFVGPIPMGMQIDHVCRNTRCVNPLHLQPVTSATNVLRHVIAEFGEVGIPGGKFCRHGHDLSVVGVADHKGNRSCRECNRIRRRKRHVAEARAKNPDWKPRKYKKRRSAAATAECASSKGTENHALHARSQRHGGAKCRGRRITENFAENSV